MLKLILPREVMGMRFAIMRAVEAHITNKYGFYEEIFHNTLLNFNHLEISVMQSMLITRPWNYMKFHILNFWSKSKVTKYIYILRFVQCNGTKEKFHIS